MTESWGEACYEVKRPVLCLADVSSGSVTVLDQIPEKISPGFATWAPNDDGIVFFGLDNEPVKLGKIYCNNRRYAKFFILIIEIYFRGSLYYYELSTAKLTRIGKEGIAVEQPVFSPDGKQLFYFQRAPDGPHQAVLELVTVPWPYNGSTPTTIVPIVKRSAFPDFPGLSMIRVTQRAFAADGKRLIVGIAWNSKLEIVAIDTETGGVKKLTNYGQCHGSWQQLDVAGDDILALVAAPNRPPALLLGVIPPAGEEEQVYPILIVKVCHVLDNLDPPRQSNNN